MEFAEWMAYYTIEPFGDDWLRTASIISMIANANRDAKVKTEPFKPEDFMPHIRVDPPADRVIDWRETKRRFMALVQK
jgi:hypothetical protein